MLEKIVDITVGIKPYQTNKGKPKQTKEDVKNRIYDSEKKLDKEYQPFIVGRDITKYNINAPTNHWIKYGENLAEPRKTLDFKKPRIVLRQTSDHIIASIDNGNYLNLNNVHNIIVTNEKVNINYLIVILNSRLIDFIYKYLVPESGRVFAEVKTINLDKLPIKIIDNDLQNSFIESAEYRFKVTEEFINEINAFKEWLSREPISIEKFSKKIDKYYGLSFDEFLSELKKKNVNIKPRKTQELLKKEFEESISKINPLLQEIKKTDNEIDQMVYELYGLSDDEIAIVEKSLDM